MSDLISRGVLLKKMNDTGVQITFDLPVDEILGKDVNIDDFIMLVQDAIQAYRKMVIATINELPTAYDVEMVVKDLEESSYTETVDDMDPYGDIPKKVVRLERAIDIARKGD